MPATKGAAALFPTVSFVVFFADCYHLFADSQGRCAAYGGDRVALKIAEILRQFHDVE
jgi:hypothetical protein